MERLQGTVVRGLRTPIFKEGDNLVEEISHLLMRFYLVEQVKPKNKDIISITESVVARAQGNYAHIDDIARDFHSKFPENEAVGIIFPILSRNRFATSLKGFARGAAMGNREVILMLSYPSDEVGNSLAFTEVLEKLGVNPWTDVLSEREYRAIFGEFHHLFTGVDYVEFYRQILESEGVNCQVVFANIATSILPYTKNVLNCDIHSRDKTKDLLCKAGAKKVLTLAEILNKANTSHGYNEEYGLLGANAATENTIKLFPRDCQRLVMDLQARMKELTGKLIEVMVYGDGAFKDPVGQIWELADPVVSPGFTPGLSGTPSEVKIKYLADNTFSHLKGDDLKGAIKNHLAKILEEDISQAESLGTTPRRLTDLIGSLSDLTSGSGDKGTPLVYIQGYFDKFSID
ncbi:MAG TPA: coenzyme F420-0:L-glutamate ligase [Clostridia bacterium]|nr:coenzyme F420-0:L-glutamate ligase [Clostridia bacterium]